MKWIHHTATIIEEVYSVDQQTIHHKPKGFWISLGNEWRDWCMSERYPLGKHIYEVKIDSANILMIDNLCALHLFNDIFSLNNYTTVDWGKVSSLYHGIVILPNQLYGKYDKSIGWWYTWDIASGCIWNKESIKQIIRRK